MTSRDSYRRPVSSEAALAELRRVAGSQLDPVVVEAFETMILERGIGFRHTDAADFETRARVRQARRRLRPSAPHRGVDTCSIKRPLRYTDTGA